MFTITTPADDRVDIEVRGSIDSDEMRAGLDALIDKSKDISNGKMLYTIKEFEMPTLGALTVEMQHLPGLFSLLGKFDRCAVVTDASWLRTAAEIEGRLIPGLEIRGFEEKAAHAAENWLASA
jgi:hypothetical protein